VENAYDWRDRRISKTVSRYDSTAEGWNVVERRAFTYDDWNLVHETIMQIGGAVPTTAEMQYFWGLDLSETQQGAGGVGGLLAASMNGSFYFPCYDNNGNVTKYVDETGAVVASYAYDDFGRIISQAGSLADVFPHRFSTKYYDVETCIFYYGRRFYSTLFKCWINRDPIGEEGGNNIFAFCMNKSLYEVDVYGLYELTLISDYTANGDVLSWYLSGNSWSIKEYDIHSKQQLFNLMAKHNLRWGAQITVLNLSGHGVGGGSGISFVDGTAFDVARLTKDDLRTMRSLVAPNAVIKIWSCDAAETYEKCISLQNAAYQMDVSIYAKVGEVSTGPDGTFLSQVGRRIAAWVVGSKSEEWKVFHPRHKIHAPGFKKSEQNAYKITENTGVVR
jgi:RHS repeat-associated protein